MRAPWVVQASDVPLTFTVTFNSLCTHFRLRSSARDLLWLQASEVGVAFGTDHTQNGVFSYRLTGHTSIYQMVLGPAGPTDADRTWRDTKAVS